MKEIRVMIAGLPGKMATLVAEHVERAEDMELMDFALTEDVGKPLKIGETKVFQVPLAHHDAKLKELPPDIIVDFTLPRSVIRNAGLYCECEIPFVMGTTGGDRDLLIQTVESSNISAVIAPNMAKQIVVFQAMMKYAAENFPNAFKGYNLVIRESHQKQKADTSGTARQMVKYFNQLGIPIKTDQIIRLRDPDEQLVIGVPAEYLDGHGWHNYSFCSKDGNVLFRFFHNVNGRDVYAQGTLDAIRFLAKHKKNKGKVFSMIDVLKAG